MRGSHRRNRRLTAAGATFTMAGLLMSLFLTIGQIGIVAAGAADRDRSDSFVSDTTVVSGHEGRPSGSASATKGSSVLTAVHSSRAPAGDITICHATGANANPYIQITVNVNGSGNGGLTAHIGHTGPIWAPPSQPPNSWGDIIPPNDDNGVPTGFGGLNFSALGQSILADGCDFLPHLGSVTKGGPASVSVGSSGNTYTVSVTNNGAGNAPNVTIVDDVPTGFSVTSVAWAKTNPAASGTCAATDPVNCNVGTLAPGQSVTVTITFSVGSAACPGPVDNTASVGSANSNTVQTTITNCPVGTAPDISIVKSGPVSINPGDPFSYTLTVTNLGNATSLGVGVTDTVPADLAITSVSPSPACGAAGQLVTCGLGNILAGASVVVTINVTHNGTSCANLHNAATVTTTSVDDPVDAHNTDDADTTVTCAPDLTLGKSGPASIQQGAAFSYTVTVKNSGTANATGVIVVDDLDDSLSGVSATSTQGSCLTSAVNLITCTVGIVTPNQTVTITVHATAPVGVCPFISNQATGTFGRGSVIPPSGIVTTQVSGCGGPGGGNAGLAITKTADAGSVPAGSPVGFTITVFSAGTADALGVHLSDPLPTVPGMTWSIAGGSGAALCSIGANVLNCNFGNMVAGTQLSVHVTSPTTVNSCATLNNTATATSSNASPVSASTSIGVTCASGIQVVKGGPAQAHVGDTITYTFDVSLLPNSPPLTNVTLADPICDPATLIGPTKTGGNQDAVLEAGEVWSYTCTHLVTAGDPDPLPNTATAAGSDPSGVVVSGSDTHLVDIIHPDIDIVKTADPTSGSPGTVITFTYSVTNSGDVDLFNVSVDDNVLGHICDIAVLHAHDTVVCTGTYRIPRNSGILITNIAIAGGTDPLGFLVTAQDDATVDVVLGKTVTPPGGVAFTGTSAVLPLGGLALLLLLLGSGMLWASRTRGKHAPGSDEG